VLGFVGGVFTVIEYRLEDRQEKNKLIRRLSVSLIFFGVFLQIAENFIGQRERTLEEAAQVRKNLAQAAREKELQDTVSFLGKELANEKLAKQIAEKHKRTPPKFDVSLVISSIRDDPNKLRFTLLMDVKNDVPYEFQWNLSDRKGQFLDTTIWIGWGEVRPQPGKTRWSNVKVVDLKRLKQLEDDYIKVEVFYRSVYAKEIGLPELQGKIVKEYNLSELRKWITKVPSS